MDDSSELLVRQSLLKAERIVVKVGTRVLSDSNGALQHGALRHLAEQIAGLRELGKEVLLVTSGAVAAGVETLGLKQRPREMPELQMAASVGQSKLMACYSEAFSSFGITVGQVLLTHDCLDDRERHLNIRNTFYSLFNHKILPIINENDVVSIREMKFGDNDFLASLVTLLVGAEVLVILTTAKGVCRWENGKLGTVISHIERIDDSIRSEAKEAGDKFSIGGMQTKVQAAHRVVSAGGIVGIISGEEPNNLLRFIQGEQVGTICGTAHTQGDAVKAARKRWLAFFRHTQGAISIDAGAATALITQGRSLLPIGITAVSGNFSVGALVDVCGVDGTAIARGLVGFASDDIEKIKGRHSSDVQEILGNQFFNEVIHRDNLVLLREF